MESIGNGSKKTGKLRHSNSPTENPHSRHKRVFAEILYIYLISLLDIYLILPPWGRHATTSRKEITKKKRIGAEGETIHPNPGNGCAYGGRRKEQNTEGRAKEKNREREREKRREYINFFPNINKAIKAFI